MTKKLKDTITITEKNNSININIEMESLTPCVNAIKQYNPSFKAQDIINESKYFQGSLIESITENYNEVLYEIIENQRDHKTQNKESIS